MLVRLTLLLSFVTALALVILRAALPSPPTAALGAFGRGPTLVFVHGLGSSASDWLPLARDLGRDHRVVFVELPGHGLAGMPGHLTLERAAALLDDAIGEQSDGPVTLVGHSVGGLVAVEEALERPERVRGLVLLETALRPQLGAAERAALLAALDRDYRETLHASYESFGRDSAQGEMLYERAALVDSSVIKPWIRLAVSEDLSAAARGLRMPVLAVFSDRSWGEREAWGTIGDTLGYGAIQNVSPVRIRGAGHYLMLDRPIQLAALIRHFDRATVPPFIALR